MSLARSPHRWREPPDKTGQPCIAVGRLCRDWSICDRSILIGWDVIGCDVTGRLRRGWLHWGSSTRDSLVCDWLIG